MEKYSSLVEMPDHRGSQRLELGVAVAEIVLIVVRTLLRHGTAFRAFPITYQIRKLTGPTTGRALNPVLDPGDQFVKRNIQRDHRIKREVMVAEPVFKEQGLRQAAGKSIQHPAAGLALQPLGQNRVHQIIRQVSATIQNGSGLLAESGAVLDSLSQQGSRAQIAETKGFRESSSLGSLAGSRRPKESDAEWSR